MGKPNNRLAEQSSPYLRQHADNPVDWQPWDEQALRQAREQDKPILLSIGYSACHWCHVMAHESFEDPATAQMMNRDFINIKVDREERPDLDKIYQTAHSLLTSRSGGWPLTVFLSPDNHMPFFAGTYFPDQRRYNMPAFSEILQIVAQAYSEKKQQIAEQDASISQILQDICMHSPKQGELNRLPLDLARKELESAFDSQFGGFSPAPKFPHADMLERCLRHALALQRQGLQDEKALHMAFFTLDKMALGGFQDQLGGGFYRYSTDEHWMIPHFEKMLYDNAQLLTLYAQAYSLSSKPLYLDTLSQCAEWIIREMQLEDGGYISALDADTDQVEGKSYVWTPQQIEALLDEDEYRLCVHKFGLSNPANFESHWHLHGQTDNPQLGEALKLSPQKIDTLLKSLRRKLLEARGQRNQPGRDEKILCAWNALMIRGMSQAGRRSANPAYVNSASQATEFIFKTLWRDSRLLASYKDGKAHLNAYLDDYAFLLQALLELLQSQWSTKHYQWALAVADSLLEHFEDSEHGGFYFTSHDHEQLLYRSKTFADDALPNGNAVAANALWQLGLISANSRYLEAAERTLRCAYNELQQHAISHCSLLHALEQFLEQGTLIILRGEPQAMASWKKLNDYGYLPNTICFYIERDSELPESLKDKVKQGAGCAYICQGTHCLPVITDYPAYADALNMLQAPAGESAKHPSGTSK